MEMEREGIYCIRRSFVSESDSGIETLSLDGMDGSPKLTKLGNGSCYSLFKKVGLESRF
jgi:hypothetical protein